MAQTRRQDGPSVVRCPRCEVRGLPGAQGRPGRALSRVTRDGGAKVDVCSDCGEREAERDALGWPPVPLTAWPVSVDDLLREDRERYKRARRSRMSVMRIGPDEARRMLGEDA